jgi:high-affinity iron transporter
MIPASSLALLALALATPARAELPPPTPALLERGQAAYAKHCLRCHGPKGEGDGPAAAGLRFKPFNLARHRLQARFVFQAISEGIKGTPMPSFARLPEAERWAIAHHVETLGPAR